MIEESLDVAGVELDRVLTAIEDRRGELVILVEDLVGRGAGGRRFILVDVVGGGRGLVSSGRLRIAVLVIVALNRSRRRNRCSDLFVRTGRSTVETVTWFRTLLDIMPTAVKVHEDAKSRLEELQAEIRLETGRNVTQQDLLTRLIDEAYESREEVIESFRDSSVPLSAEEKAAMRRGRFNSGVETDEDDIDDIIYG